MYECSHTCTDALAHTHMHTHTHTHTHAHTQHTHTCTHTHTHTHSHTHMHTQDYRYSKDVPWLAGVHWKSVEQHILDKAHCLAQSNQLVFSWR